LIKASRAVLVPQVAEYVHKGLGWLRRRRLGRKPQSEPRSASREDEKKSRSEFAIMGAPLEIRIKPLINRLLAIKAI